MMIIASWVLISCKSQQIPESTGNATVVTRDGEKRDRRQPPSIDEVFKMDIDQDGFLSLEEVSETPLARDFAKIDTNEDGLISREEFEKAPRPERGQRQRKNRQ